MFTNLDTYKKSYLTLLHIETAQKGDFGKNSFLIMYIQRRNEESMRYRMLNSSLVR